MNEVSHRRRSSKNNNIAWNVDDSLRGNDVKNMDNSKNVNRRSSAKMESFTEKAFGPNGDEVD